MNIEKGEARRDLGKELQLALEELRVREKLSAATLGSAALQEDVEKQQQKVERIRALIGESAESGAEA